MRRPQEAERRFQEAELCLEREREENKGDGGEKMKKMKREDGRE